jgi:hypothetical protein
MWIQRYCYSDVVRLGFQCSAHGGCDDGLVFAISFLLMLLLVSFARIYYYLTVGLLVSHPNTLGPFRMTVKLLWTETKIRCSLLTKAVGHLFLVQDKSAAAGWDIAFIIIMSDVGVGYRLIFGSRLHASSKFLLGYYTHPHIVSCILSKSQLFRQDRIIVVLVYTFPAHYKPFL